MSYTDTILNQAEQALREGRKGEVRRLVAPIVEAEPQNGRAWHLLADASDDEAQAQFYRDKAGQAGMPIPQRSPAPPMQPQYQQQPQPYQQQVAYQQQPPPHQSAFTPFSPPPPAPKGAPAAAGTMLGGAAMIILGSLMPWATISAGLFQRSMNGIDGDGKITIVGGILALLAGITLFTRPVAAARILGVLGAIISGGIAIMDLINVSGTSTGVASMSIGVGLYLIPLGALLVLVASGMQRTPAAPSYPTLQQPRR
jgi:hypothetical protein